MDQVDPDTILQWLRELPPERIAQVADFVEFLRGRERGDDLVRAAAALTSSRLAELWDNPLDATYDAL